MATADHIIARALASHNNRKYIFAKLWEKLIKFRLWST